MPSGDCEPEDMGFVVELASGFRAASVWEVPCTRSTAANPTAKNALADSSTVPQYLKACRLPAIVSC